MQGSRTSQESSSPPHKRAKLDDTAPTRGLLRHLKRRSELLTNSCRIELPTFQVPSDGELEPTEAMKRVSLAWFDWLESCRDLVLKQSQQDSSLDWTDFTQVFSLFGTLKGLSAEQMEIWSRALERPKLSGRSLTLIPTHQLILIRYIRGRRHDSRLAYM
jgi:hypothetical protein